MVFLLQNLCIDLNVGSHSIIQMLRRCSFTLMGRTYYSKVATLVSQKRIPPARKLGCAEGKLRSPHAGFGAMSDAIVKALGVHAS